MEARESSSSSFVYKRHEPEKTLLYKVLAKEWQTWLAERREDTSRSPLPDYVVREVDAFFRCGLLEHGFVLLSCDGCGSKLPVAFSCKYRGFCPSCSAKRQAETTAHLLDNVLPHTPYRQFVTTMPHALRFWLATNRKLTSAVHQIVTAMILAYYEHKAEERGIKGAQSGGATFVQRFGSALNLNVHFHTLVVEGVYSLSSGSPVFYHLPGPSDEELADIVGAVAAAVIDHLQNKGYLDEASEIDIASLVDPIFADSEQMRVAMAASARMRIAFGERAGGKVRRIGRGFGYEEEIPVAKGPRCYAVNGFTIHANRYIGQQERRKLEGLVSYCARGAFSHQRLSLANPGEPDGDLVYELKSQWSDGTQAIVLSASEFIEKLVALVPPPYLHLTRYFGVLASHNKWRRLIVLKPHVKKGFVATSEDGSVERMSWARLLARTFKLDLNRCLSCGQRLYPGSLEIVTLPPIVQALLDHLGLMCHPPPIQPARRRPLDAYFDQTIVHADEMDQGDFYEE